MARPIKSGLDYFPLDVDMDDKIELIEAKHGITGFGVIIKILQTIYKNGFYFEATEDKMLLLSKRINVDINSINAIIMDALKWKMFDEKIFNKYKVLTSCGIQKRYAEAVKRRKEVTVQREYCLVCFETLCGDAVNVIINQVNADINPKKDDNSTQRKGKETKENIYTRVVDYLNRKTNSKFKPQTKATIQFIDARVKEGFLPEDFKAVIDFKSKQWIGDPENQQYLRPATLFGNKFEGYLEAARRAQNPINSTPRKTPEQIKAEINEALS
jgi:uncharacterized phage protein (TIGR02220 family)